MVVFVSTTYSWSNCLTRKSATDEAAETKWVEVRKHVNTSDIFVDKNRLELWGVRMWLNLKWLPAVGAALQLVVDWSWCSDRIRTRLLMCLGPSVPSVSDCCLCLWIVPFKLFNYFEPFQAAAPAVRSHVTFVSRCFEKSHITVLIVRASPQSC